MADAVITTGGCLCGSVQYEISGPMRDVIYCHCRQCRKTSGHFVAATAANPEDVKLTKQKTLRWYRSSEFAERGFCKACGSNLFWRPTDLSRLSIMAGTLNGPTGLKAREHIYVKSAGDYYTIDDGLPCHATRPPPV